MERALLLLLCAPAVLGFCPGFFKDQTACSCFAYVDGAVIKCSGPDGPAVVEKLKNVQTEIRELAIENANIVEIGPRAFRNLRIKKLVLDDNRIKAIHSDAFRGLESTMQELSLAFNKLTEIPTDSLLGMRNLMILNLKCNQIGDIYGSVFRNVSNLIELNLGCNQICKVQGPAFHGIKDSLQSLILDQNCLQEIPSEALRNFDNLLALHLQYNQIASVDKLQLMNLTNLLMLKLTGNKIRSVDKNGLTNVPNLRYIYLNENELTSIVPGTFQQFKFLEIIDMSSNNIAEIATDTFNGLEHMMQLNLEGNAIKDIAPGAFSSTPLLLLMLASNCLTSVNQNMFQGVPFLRQLSLGNNNIRLVQPLSFSHLANLHLLDLSSNKMQVVQPGALTASPHVTVMLQENPLVCSQDGYHIVQGGQAIHLLNEPNLICQTDFTRDDKDKCPTRKERPAPPPCCQKFKNATTRSPLLATTWTPTTVSSLAPAVVSQPIPTEVQPSAVGVTARSRAVNMERFWRLSRRPTGSLRPDAPALGADQRQAPPAVPQPPSTPVINAGPVGPQTPQLNGPQTIAGAQPPAPSAPPAAAPVGLNIPSEVGVVPALAQNPQEPNDPFRNNRGPFLPDSGLLAGQLRASAPGVDANQQRVDGSAVDGQLQAPARQASNAFVSATDIAAPATQFIARQQFIPPRVPNVQQTNTFVQPPIPANQAPGSLPPAPPLQPNFVTTPQPLPPQPQQQQSVSVPPRVQARQLAQQQQQQQWTPEQQQALQVQQQWLQQWPSQQPQQQPQQPAVPEPQPQAPTQQEQWQWSQPQQQTPPQPAQQEQESSVAPPTFTQLPQASTSGQAAQTPRDRPRLPVQRLPEQTAGAQVQQTQVQTTRLPQQTQLPDQLHSQLPPWIVTESKNGNKDESISFNSDSHVQRVAVDERPIADVRVRTAAKH